MNRQKYLLGILQNYLIRTQLRNKNFSQRALARKLGVQPSTINDVLQGKRNISPQLAELMALNLGLNPSVRANILRVATNSVSEKECEEIEQAHKLSIEEFASINDWPYFAILSFLKMESFKSDIPWLSKRLNLGPDKINLILETLERLKLIEKGPDGNFKRKVGNLYTTEDIPDSLIKESHIRDIKLAEEKLGHSLETSDFSSMVIPLDPALLSRARDILRKAQDDIAVLMREASPKEVYKVSTYLFPLTTNEGEMK